ncbi:hypothetical protein [Tepidibacter hydrothermalis]|uniref:Uncharacterized protein n=1 Tax=Tepidibacter hydrothermalis TaxID=3036126 RepID=A0ABY8EA38_9FIRM|nr:hypothetical protein [Tepidibacter hydrothermalis]WFD09768.1 hypothetical protein P4S50_15425 [Tepidibacter hydrothermalis]
MIYIPLEVLEEINECKHEIKELDKAISEVTKIELKNYLSDTRDWFVNRLNELESKVHVA